MQLLLNTLRRCQPSPIPPADFIGELASDLPGAGRGLSPLLGAEFARGSPETRVLILTMHENRELVRSALAAGASGYIVKTSADTELVTAIRRVHGGRSYLDVALGKEALQYLSTEAGAKGKEPPPCSLESLSSRERQVLELVAYGHTNREVAEQLEISIKSVATYRSRLTIKLGLRSRVDLVRYAIDHGVITTKSRGPR